MLGRRMELMALFMAAAAATVLGLGGPQTVLAANTDYQAMQLETLLQTEHGKAAMARLGLSLDDVQEMTRKLSPEQLRRLERLARDAHPKARLTAQMIASGYSLEEAKERISVLSDDEVTKLANDPAFMHPGSGTRGIAIVVILLLALLGLLWWWLSGDEEAEAAPAQPDEQPGPKAVVEPAPMGATRGHYEPTSGREGSVVLVEKFAPSEVLLGQPYDYQIKLTNLTQSQLVDVKFTDRLPQGFKIDSSTPEAKNVPDGKVEWTVGELGPKESKTIQVRGTATGAGTNVHCGVVSYKRPYCAVVNVVDPKLDLAKTSPGEVLLGDDITLKMVVKNVGTGTAKNVKIVDNLPEGLATVDGQSTLTFAVGDLKAGEAREVTAVVRAAKTGTFVNTANATALGDRKASAKATTIVRQPVLTLAKTGTKQQYINRHAEYKLTVTNTGDAVAKNTVITDPLPAGATFVSASDNGQLKGGVITWALGDLAPEASKTVTLVVSSSQPATLLNTAEATAHRAKPATANAQTVYVGIPAILLEVVDVEDPVEVGQTETYTITVTNQGTAADSNVKVVCTLEDTQEYVSSAGPAEAKVDGKTITFAPIATLAPKAQVSLRVVVKAVKEGDVRFRASLSSDHLKRPVVETEATTQYK